MIQLLSEQTLDAWRGKSPDKANLFIMGPPRTGKSTHFARFLKQPYQFLATDIYKAHPWEEQKHLVSEELNRMLEQKVPVICEGVTLLRVLDMKRRWGFEPYPGNYVWLDAYKTETTSKQRLLGNAMRRRWVQDVKPWLEAHAGTTETCDMCKDEGPRLTSVGELAICSGCSDYADEVARPWPPAHEASDFWAGVADVAALADRIPPERRAMSGVRDAIRNDVLPCQHPHATLVRGHEYAPDFCLDCKQPIYD